MNLLYYPFIIQGIFILADEFYYHERRGLPKWEIIGHPLDSLTTLVPLSIPALLSYNKSILNLFIGFAIFSFIFVTKDEFIHGKICNSTEQWIHSILYILHPVVFAATSLLWIHYPEDIFVKIQPLIVGGFMFYQILRWSLRWKKIVE